MTFIHRLENAIASVLNAEELRAALEEQLNPRVRSVDTVVITKRIARELYFELDAPLLIDLAMHKMNEAYEVSGPRNAA